MPLLVVIKDTLITIFVFKLSAKAHWRRYAVIFHHRKGSLNERKTKLWKLRIISENAKYVFFLGGGHIGYYRILKCVFFKFRFLMVTLISRIIYSPATWLNTHTLMLLRIFRILSQMSETFCHISSRDVIMWLWSESNDRKDLCP